ncbi:MAG: hypothetical protein H9893_04545 [Candidatus Niameybacter stercoravium]|nr:hypothetical protein [Candidatus Niameybacter stercoravium]
MRCVDDISFTACEVTKCVKAGVHIDDEGHMLTVPVYLYDVCPCREVIVGVQVYVDGRLYAIKTKKVCTGGCRYCGRIHEKYVDDFCFLFAGLCDEKIDIKILAHYIY